MRRLVVRFDLPEGLHIYDEPVPTGMVATSFTLVGPDGLRSLPVEKPPTQPFELPGVGQLQVWSGRVDFEIPVWATDEIASLVRSDSPDRVTIELDVAYQACDDEVCRLPRTERLELHDNRRRLAHISISRRARGTVRDRHIREWTSARYRLNGTGAKRWCCLGWLSKFRATEKVCAGHL